MDEMRKLYATDQSAQVAHVLKVLPDFRRALADPDTFCISGACPDTNWGGRDRLHERDRKCPPFSQEETEGHIARGEQILINAQMKETKMALEPEALKEEQQKNNVHEALKLITLYWNGKRAGRAIIAENFDLSVRWSFDRKGERTNAAINDTSSPYFQNNRMVLIVLQDQVASSVPWNPAGSKFVLELDENDPTAQAFLRIERTRLRGIQSERIEQLKKQIEAAQKEIEELR